MSRVAELAARYQPPQGQEFIHLSPQPLPPRDSEIGLSTLDGVTVTPTDGWIGTKDAAAYLGLSVNALHKLTAAQRIQFEQDCPGGKCWFKRSDLDAYRRGER